VTDANLALGRLDPENFAGGAIPLHPDRAEAALNTLGLMLDEAAFGITEMVDENMANAARVHTVENGRDIAQFTMVAFGGGAPLHACRLCEKLGLDEALIPPGAGVGSAIGFLQAPVSFEATRGLYQRLDAFDPQAVNAMLEDLAEAANAFVARGAGDAARTTRLIDRCATSGRAGKSPSPCPIRPFTQDDVPMIVAAFEAAYRTLFGRIIEGLVVEVTNWQLTVATEVPPVPEATRYDSGPTAPSHPHTPFLRRGPARDGRRDRGAPQRHDARRARRRPRDHRGGRDRDHRHLRLPRGRTGRRQPAPDPEGGQP
jgi:N-methylhydantoinase A